MGGGTTSLFGGPRRRSALQARRARLDRWQPRSYKRYDSPQLILTCRYSGMWWYLSSRKLSSRPVSPNDAPARAASPPLITEVPPFVMPSEGASTLLDRKWIPKPAPM